MIYSMTGFGKGTAESKKITAEVEIKSVNSRYFEVYLKLPPALYAFEYELKEIIKSKVKRGKVSAVFTVKTNGTENGAISIDNAELKNQISLINKIKKTAKIKDDLKLEHLLNNKDIFTSSDISLGSSGFAKVKSALLKALKELNNMKKDEGSALSKDILARLKSVELSVNQIEKNYKSGINDHYEKLKERINELLNNAEIDKERLNLELALLADRADITEECVRLKSHIKFFRNSLEIEKEPGRKLNFLCQEINREANTISSKSVSTSIVHKAVLIKEEIEKIREQVQNIE
jgi:uncharacterized protein (TIGR00255 family)